MDEKRFDRWSVVIGTADASRRTLLHRVGGRGLAAALATLGLAGLVPPDAAAKQGHHHRHKRKKRKKRAPRRAGAGFPITITQSLLNLPCTLLGGQCGVPTVTGLVCGLLGVCTPAQVATPTPCTTGATCQTGACLLGICALCDPLKVCGAGPDLECCVADARCDPVLKACVLRTR